MSGRLDWEREGRAWPNREASRFLQAGGVRWHVQVMGSGPVMLLIHGTGASTHSWRDCAPLLAKDYTVVVPDLPGHGFSIATKQSQLSLPGMARGLAELIKALELPPVFVAGHSAGAAVGLRMILDGQIAPKVMISVNGAIMPFTGLPAVVFPPLAKLLFMNPMASWVATRIAAGPDAVDRTLQGTGSRLDARGLGLYTTLFRNRRHVEATLGMMARWNLAPFAHDLPKLKVPLVLIVAGNDLAVPPSRAMAVTKYIPQAKIMTVPGLGHLAHEEDPAQFARLISSVAKA